eukprot:4308069-Amphidinium_carterae.1
MAIDLDVTNGLCVSVSTSYDKMGTPWSFTGSVTAASTRVTSSRQACQSMGSLAAPSGSSPIRTLAIAAHPGDSSIKGTC